MEIHILKLGLRPSVSFKCNFIVIGLNQYYIKNKNKRKK